MTKKSLGKEEHNFLQEIAILGTAVEKFKKTRSHIYIIY